MRNIPATQIIDLRNGSRNTIGGTKLRRNSTIPVAAIAIPLMNKPNLMILRVIKMAPDTKKRGSLPATAPRIRLLYLVYAFDRQIFPCGLFARPAKQTEAAKTRKKPAQSKLSPD